MAGKLVVMCTHGPQSPERATLAFVMATSAQASDMEVVVGLQADGVSLAAPGVADTVTAAGFPPLGVLLAAYLEGGGQFLVCGPCLLARSIDPKALVEGAVVVGAATFVAECVSADSSLVY